MDYGDNYWRLYRDYYRDPFPHSLLSTRQNSTSLGSDDKIPQHPIQQINAQYYIHSN